MSTKTLGITTSTMEMLSSNPDLVKITFYNSILSLAKELDEKNGTNHVDEVKDFNIIEVTHAKSCVGQIEKPGEVLLGGEENSYSTRIIISISNINTAMCMDTFSIQIIQTKEESTILVDDNNGKYVWMKEELPVRLINGINEVAELQSMDKLATSFSGIIDTTLTKLVHSETSDLYKAILNVPESNPYRTLDSFSVHCKSVSLTQKPCVQTLDVTCFNEDGETLMTIPMNYDGTSYTSTAPVRIVGGVEESEPFASEEWMKNLVVEIITASQDVIFGIHDIVYEMADKKGD